MTRSRTCAKHSRPGSKEKKPSPSQSRWRSRSERDTHSAPSCAALPRGIDTPRRTGVSQQVARSGETRLRARGGRPCLAHLRSTARSRTARSPALILSPRIYNARAQLAVACPHHQPRQRISIRSSRDRHGRHCRRHPGRSCEKPGLERAPGRIRRQASGPRDG